MASQKPEVIGGRKNFWLYSKEHGYDLTHPPTADSAPVCPRLSLQTAKENIAIDPAKTALVVIDLQNYFLSPSIGRPSDGGGIKAAEKLAQFAIPGCRKAGIQIVWLNWGLTQEDIDVMPPAILKGFLAHYRPDNNVRFGGLGRDIGPVKLADGSEIEGGKVLMRDQWNSALYHSLEKERKPEDLWIHKNRLSGLWGGTEADEILASKGIKTLIFAGVNTDQCVGGSLEDAVSKGWDCLLLNNGSATTSPEFAQQGIEYNVARGWGFLLSCEQLAQGVENMQSAPGAGS